MSAFTPYQADLSLETIAKMVRARRKWWQRKREQKLSGCHPLNKANERAGACENTGNTLSRCDSAGALRGLGCADADRSGSLDLHEQRPSGSATAKVWGAARDAGPLVENLKCKASSTSYLTVAAHSKSARRIEPEKRGEPNRKPETPRSSGSCLKSNAQTRSRKRDSYTSNSLTAKTRADAVAASGSI